MRRRGPQAEQAAGAKAEFRRVSGLGDMNGEREGGSLKMPL